MGIFLWAVPTVETYDCKISKRQSRYHFRSSWLAKNELFLEKNSPWTHTDRALKYSVQHRFLPIREKSQKTTFGFRAVWCCQKPKRRVDDRGHPSERPTPLVRRTTPGEATWAFETRSGAWLRRSPRRRPRSRGTANRAPRTSGREPSWRREEERRFQAGGSPRESRRTRARRDPCGRSPPRLTVSTLDSYRDTRRDA